MARQLGLALALALALALCASPIAGVMLDIHIEFDDDDYFNNLDKQIHKLLPNDQIDLINTSMPHVTLYMTEFEDSKLSKIIEETSKVVKTYGASCPIDLRGITISGNYSMWDVYVNPCLQKWSDLMADQLARFMVPDQPIPDWVEGLPEPLKSEKIAMIKKYGSPNVFSQFQPHVTLAWDSIDRMQPAFQHLNLPPRIVSMRAVAIGTVGPYGTVTRGKNFAYFPVN